VTADGVSPFLEVEVDQLEGVSPLTVNFTITNHSTTTATVQFNGGTAFTIGAGLSGSASATYTGAQASPATFTATDGSGNNASVSRTVVVHDPVSMDRRFTTLINTMNQALIAGDKSSALAVLSGPAQTIYSPIFDALMPSYASIATSFSPLQRNLVAGGLAEYAINRTINGVNEIFFVYFLKGPDGIWRLDSL
jgi:hypothetical protein